MNQQFNILHQMLINHEKALRSTGWVEAQILVL